jgi:hypothetical protein
MSHGLPRRVGVRRYSSFVDLVNKECKLQVKPGALHPSAPVPCCPREPSPPPAPATSAQGLGSPLPTSAPGLGSPLPTSAPRLGAPLPTSAPGLSSPLPTSAPRLGAPLPTSVPGLGLTPAASAPGLRSLLTHLRQDCARRCPHRHRGWTHQHCHIRTGTGHALTGGHAPRSAYAAEWRARSLADGRRCAALQCAAVRTDPAQAEKFFLATVDTVRPRPDAADRCWQA